MPSRQERRQAERDAAKRAPAQAVAVAQARAAGAAGAGGAAAAPATVNVNPLGDWTTQEKDPSALFLELGAETVYHRAAAGDTEAQWSQVRGGVLSF